MILVSVIIPCYNSERYIVQSIESVIMQTFQQWEMIIVDDCSTDNSADIIKKYEAKDFRIKHILGARNLPAGQIDQSLNALSKHKPVLIYENGRPVGGAKVAKKLKKAGIPGVYILKSGLNSWNGKTKSGI